MPKQKGARVHAEEAVEAAVKSGDRVIIPIGCGEPRALLHALVNQKERLRNVEIVGGVMVNYPFLGEGLAESFHFRTWQSTGKIAKLLGTSVSYMPIRQSDVPCLFRHDGPYPVQVAMIHVSPPDQHGFCSLGVSVSHSLPTALEADVIIAQVNRFMPRVLGDCFIHTSQIDYLVEVDEPLVEYVKTGTPGEKDRQIAHYICDLIPDGATLQVGLGSIPETVIEMLADKHNLSFFGMGVDGIVDLIQQGVVTACRTLDNQVKVRAGEFLGTRKLFDMADNNPMFFGQSSLELFDSRVIGSIKDFVSLQSAIEVDIYGQVNIETIRGQQFSAIGGSFDFLQGAYHAPGGKSVIAITSTTADGKTSRIVPTLVAGTAVAHPRHSVEFVVTEYGAAYLRGKSLEERAQALINIAHPDFRDELKIKSRGQ